LPDAARFLRFGQVDGFGAFGPNGCGAAETALCDEQLHSRPEGGRDHRTGSASRQGRLNVGQGGISAHRDTSATLASYGTTLWASALLKTDTSIDGSYSVFVVGNVERSRAQKPSDFARDLLASPLDEGLQAV
jgi:hypothetical protein